ncbi:MAG: hypothetical protein KC729_17975, partial [Candidatus Eisenbacteria bacterium]|nr:hypothetical protein [Candidatus Eisenbacteria bacterium]
DDSAMSNDQFPGWVLRESDANENDARMTIHPRLSRLGARMKGIVLDEKTTGSLTVEIDFQNGGSESRETPRMRHAFFQIDRGQASFLIGQTWDLFSPLYPAANNDGLMWNAGNLGDRRPQARVALHPAMGGEGQIELAAGIAMAGAIDNADLDGNGVMDGLDAAAPMLEGRLGIQQPMGQGKLKAGVSGHWATKQLGDSVAAALPAHEDITSWSAGLDLSVPLGGKATLEAEAWTGENLADVRGGIGQAVNFATGDPIASTGGWANVTFQASPKVTLAAGGSLDNPKDEDLPVGGRTLNQTIFGVVKYKPWKRVQLALEYVNWKTEYETGDADVTGEGTANRFDAHATFSL